MTTIANLTFTSIRSVFFTALLASPLMVAAQEASDKVTKSQALAEELGSLRNAKVAVEMPNGRVALTYFTRSITKEDRERLLKVAPNLNIVTGLSHEEAVARAAEADGVDSRYAKPDFLEKATKLKWVQVFSAGVDRYLSVDSLMKNDDIVLTNFRAVHGPSIADHAMAMLLYQTRNLKHYVASQQKGEWDRKASPKASYTLKGKTMLVVGIGGIGQEIAQRAHGFGMRVIGTRRSDSASPSFIEKVGKPKDLLKLLPEADVVALAVPLTPETTNLIDKEAFAAMKKGSYLINIARGKVVNTEALLENLQSGKLAAACLDVTDPEPLPKGHALWQEPNVIITPHISGQSEVTDQRRAALRIENLRRFAAGEVLLNVVNKKVGY